MQLNFPYSENAIRTYKFPFKITDEFLAKFEIWPDGTFFSVPDELVTPFFEDELVKKVHLKWKRPISIWRVENEEEFMKVVAMHVEFDI